MQTTPDYDDLVGEATGLPLTGWEFAWMDGRAAGFDPSWSYPDLARPLVRRAHSLLDLDTGGGELLADLAPLPAHTVAVESWAPNIPVARDRLTPFGVTVVTDKMSAPYLMGARIDYLDTIERQGFTIDNPNAQGSCACGESFH